LLPEMTVFSAQADDDGTTYVGGIADAVAYQPTGEIDLVIDWKTDVSPSVQQIELYREQLRDYLVATGAPEGLLVFVTTGQIIRVRSKLSPAATVDADPKPQGRIEAKQRRDARQLAFDF
jgi:ATP-dependent helicase/nuclease subunit A